MDGIPNLRDGLVVGIMVLLFVEKIQYWMRFMNLWFVLCVGFFFCGVFLFLRFLFRVADVF